MWKNFKGIGPSIKGPSKDITTLIPSTDNQDNLGQESREGTNSTSFPLKLPAGFSISILAKNLPGARVIKLDHQGNLWVSQTGQGIVSVLEIKDGKAAKATPIIKNLNKPHGLAFDPEDPTALYIAEQDKISKTIICESLASLNTKRCAGNYEPSKLQKIIDLPSGGNHFTRTIEFGPNKRLYISIGSTCNACSEKDSRRAKIFSINKDGSDFKEFAKGLRNSVFFTWHPTTRKMWATEMGRDLIGDDIPPDEINIVEEDKNYGWPICYGKNIVDREFHKDNHTHIRPDCAEPFEIPAFIDIPAHSAPLGLAFVPEESNWPEEYKNNLIVAFHGSWNRSQPTGYKLARYKLDKNGNPSGEQAEDFITGWLDNDNEALGRPVDILIKPDGTVYVSDDKAGVVYQIKY